MVEQPTPWHQQGVEAGEVLIELRDADVLEHTDGADGVEGAVGDVAVVLHADLHPVVEPGVADGATRPFGLAYRERDPDREIAWTIVFACCATGT